MMLYSISSAAILLASLLTISVEAGYYWARLGQPMCRGDGFGTAVSVAHPENENTFFMAVGSPDYSKDRFRQGRVEFLQFNKGSCLWENNFANSIVGERTEDRLGAGVSLSCDANRVAIAGDLSDGASRQGFVKVYQRNGRSWAQLGGTIRDTTQNKPEPSNFGLGVKLSCNGNFLGIASGFETYVYKYNNADLRWERLDFFGTRITDMAFEDEAVAVIQSGSDHENVYEHGNSDYVSVYKLDKDGRWLQRGQNISTVSSPAAVLIADDGKRVFVMFDYVGTQIYDFSSENKWVRMETAEGSAEMRNILLVSGDGKVVFLHGESDGGLESYRSFPYVDDTGNTTMMWHEFGNTFYPTESHTLVTAEVSKKGYVVILGYLGRLEAYFFPGNSEDETGTYSFLDCYPRQDLESARECEPEPEEDENNVAVITGSLHLDDDSAKAGASYAFGFLALVVGVMALAVWIFALMTKNRRNCMDRVENFAAGADADTTPCLRQHNSLLDKNKGKPAGASGSVNYDEEEAEDASV